MSDVFTLFEMDFKKEHPREVYWVSGVPASSKSLYVS
jgi:hypothetical protein